MQLAPLLVLLLGASGQLPDGTSGHLSESELFQFVARFHRQLDRDTDAARAEARALLQEGRQRQDLDAIAIALSCEAQIVATTDGPLAADEYFARAVEATPEGRPYPAVALELARGEIASHAGDELRTLLSARRLDELIQGLPPSIFTASAKLIWIATIDHDIELETSEFRRLSAEAGTTERLDPWIWFVEHERLWEEGRVEESMALLVRVLDSALERADRRLAGSAHYSQAWMDWEAGDTESGLANVEASYEFMDALHDHDGLGRALELKACILREAGRYDEAARSVELALETIEGRGYWDLESMVHSTGADLAGILGDEEATLKHARGISRAEDHLDEPRDVALFRQVQTDLERAERERADAEARSDLQGERSRNRIQRQWGLTLFVTLLATALVAATLFMSRWRLARVNDSLRREMRAAREAESARRELEERMRGLERLEGLGLIAGGVAHDFNNLLVGVLGNAELLADSNELSADAASSVDSILDSGNRAAQLCRTLLSYAGTKSVEYESLDVTALVIDMLPVLRTAVSQGVAIEFDPGTEPVWAFGDASQVEQAVLNLVTNARDAGAETIRVRVRNEELSSDQLATMKRGAHVKPGPFAVLEVEDDGHGMDATVLEHLFDPFFTTRFPGRGLGLAVLFGIVRDQSGAVRTESRIGEGTRMTVYLAASAEKVVELFPTPPLAGQETLEQLHAVLVVDDEPLLHTVVAKHLRTVGLDSMSVSSTAEALDVVNNRSERIGAVLLDESMPGGDGHEIIGDLREKLPGVPIVLMTGHAREDVLARCGTTPPDGWLLKPFTLPALREALGSAARTVPS